MNPSPLGQLLFDFIYILVLAGIFFTATWVVAKVLNNWSIVDVAWSYGFALVGLWILTAFPWNARPFPMAGGGDDRLELTSRDAPSDSRPRTPRP